MDLLSIPHNEEKSKLTFLKMGDAEFVNPIEKTMNDTIDSYKAMQLDTFQFAHRHGKPSPLGILHIDDILKTLEWNGLKIWKEQYEEIMKSNLPDAIFEILNCTDKDTQIKVFKPPFQLSTTSLQKFIFKAWLLHGFKYSDYRFEHSQKGINEQDLPKGFRLTEENKIEVYGSTKMKEGELKNAILHRKVTIAKLLDSDTEWHCFFYNYNSIGGKESGEIPHIHYISNNWTLSRKTVLDELRKRHHSFTSSVHINYLRYG